MAEDGSPKLTGICQVIRLKELLQKWQTATLSPNNITPQEIEKIQGGIPPSISRRLRNTYISCDSDDESCASPEPPPDVPKGCLAVYVGPERQRFTIPTSYLTHSVFKVLLEKMEDEFGFEQSGGLTIPCEPETFKFLVRWMQVNDADHLCANAEGNKENNIEAIAEEGTAQEQNRNSDD